MQHKPPPHFAFFEIVHKLFVHFRSQSRRDNRLRFAARE